MVLDAGGARRRARVGPLGDAAFRVLEQPQPWWTGTVTFSTQWPTNISGTSGTAWGRQRVVRLRPSGLRRTGSSEVTDGTSEDIAAVRWGPSIRPAPPGVIPVYSFRGIPSERQVDEWMEEAATEAAALFRRRHPGVAVPANVFVPFGRDGGDEVAPGRQPGVGAAPPSAGEHHRVDAAAAPGGAIAEPSPASPTSAPQPGRVPRAPSADSARRRRRALADWRAAIDWKGDAYGEEASLPDGFQGVGEPPQGVVSLEDG